MIYYVEETKKILYILFSLCIIVIIFWFLLTPPIGIEVKSTIIDETLFMFDKLNSTTQVFSIVRTKNIAVHSNPKVDELAAFAIMPIQDAFYLYSDLLFHLLQSVSEPWLLLEHNDVVYIKDNEEEWALFNKKISTINPFAHFEVLENNILERLRFDKDILYYKSVKEAEDTSVVYFLKISSNNYFPEYLSILIINEITNTLEIIQYHFYDWNESYISDKINNQLINLPGVD